ncbi:MAG: serine/threonine-protein kinase, partial [Pseudonocardia sp.]
MSSSAEAILLDGRYRLEERVGAGSMGAVWRATDERLNRVVAVKQLLVQPGAPGFDVRGPEYGDARQRILREGRLAARLQHPNTIGVYDVVLHDDVPWLVMEYLESRTLGALLAGEGPLEPRRAADIGSQAADGLAAAHAAGIVHRDIKPGNVLIGADGTVKITDFGVSRAADDVQLTRTGLIAGTPAFLAPEVARGQTPTPASDVFALGSTVYACVEGTPPFGLDDNAYAMLYTVGGGEIRIPTRAGQLTETLMWMLHKDPEQRPTAALAREELAAVAAGRHPHPRRPGRPVDAAASTPTLVGMPVPATADEAPGPGDTQVDLAPPPSRLPAVPGVAAWRPPEPPPKPPRRPKPPRERATNRKVPLVAITAAGLAAVLLIAVGFAVLRLVDRSAQ